jgi:cold shock CspA family protein
MKRSVYLMKGRVIKYFDEKGYGFIKDENEDKRFFHISNVKGIDEITRGSLVKFSPSKNEKGLICLDIEVLKEIKPQFISVGNTNIKISNIKQFGVAKSEEIKGIKVPVYRLNPEYVRKRNEAGNNIFKKLFLPSKYLKSEEYVEVRISEFSTYEVAHEYRSPSLYYKLPYLLVRTSTTKIDKDYEFITKIEEYEAKFTYWRYLYITTYQNDNYKFYENEIDIEKTLSELNELFNS